MPQEVKPRPKEKLFRRDAGHVARVALGVLAILLLLLNLGAWAILRNVLRTQEHLLEESLETGAALIAGAIPYGNLFILEASFDPTAETTNIETLVYYAGLDIPSANALQRSIADVSKGAETFNAEVLSLDGKLLLDESGFHLDGAMAAGVEEDADLMARAATGQRVSNVINREDRTKRTYQPLRSEDGTVIALLRLTSERLNTFPGRQQIRRLTVATLLATALIVALWLALSRLIKRAVLAERMADQSDRLRALGTATAGIAHEIRNPLGIIQLSVEELAATIHEVKDPEARRRLEALSSDLQEETVRLRELSDQFLDFGRETPRSEGGPLDLATATDQTVKLFRKGLPPQVEIELLCGTGDLSVVFGENRLRQVLLNVLQNASDALGEKGGRITVRTRREKRTAVVEIEDDGPGMDAATLAQVFDPFFTTRPEGTGLGLSLSRSLVEAAGGSLSAESSRGVGTIVRLVLPLR
ncbi:hypothetical protein KQI84_04745 [bacterium]|nr:hypothetical protein [bacterium]